MTSININYYIEIGIFRIIEIYIDLFHQHCKNWVYLRVFEKELVDYEWGGKK
jgi:hypothetical protein